jgi:hypothetical protein
MAAPAGLALALLLSAAIIPMQARAQRTEFRNVMLTFEPGGPNQNGYVDAQLLVRYQVANCSRVSILPQGAAAPEMRVAPHRYWIDGREVRVPPQFAAPRITTVPNIPGTVRGRGINKPLTLQWSTVAPELPGCFVEDNGFANQTEVWPQGATDDAKLAAMREIAFHPSGNLPPLRNQQVEDHFRAIWRQVRADSVARANQQRDAVARAEQQRQDSVARARREAADAEARNRAAAQAAASRPANQGGSTSQPGSTGTGAQAAGTAPASRSGVGQVVPAPAGATAPYMRDDRGGYWKRLPDGRYQEITQQEYNAAGGETNAARAQQAAQAQAEAARQAQAEAARQAEAEAARQAQADATAEAIVATAVAAAPLVEALGNGIANVVKSMEEQYQGMTVGVLYHPAFTPGDNGLLGLSLGISMPSEGVFTGVERLFFDDFLGNAYVDLGYGLGGSDVPDEAPTIAMGIGVNLRRLAVPIGGGVPLLSGLWMPQAGYRWVGQYESNLHQPVVGITRLGKKTIMRVNATRYNGEPHIGASIGYVF